MQIRTILRILGVLLMIFSTTMLTPLLINLIFNEAYWFPFLAAAGLTFFTGTLLWSLFRNEHQELKTRDGFLIVSLFWIVLCFYGALPFLLVDYGLENITDAIFESVSGFTTTGASVIPELAKLPHALLFYRQQLQFIGGMGIVVLAVAILPMLGVGGMQLIRAETPGPMKDAKLTPRIAQTAKALWSLYVLLTLVCMLCYWLAGMDWFDALGESFATLSTGGFSMHDSSFAFYNSDLIELIGCLFMILGGTNFALHFVAFKKKSLKHYWQDEEFRFYIGLLFTASLVITMSLVAYHYFTLWATPHAMVKSLFNVISLATTTGFISAPFSDWPTYVPILIMLLAIIGGCAASTAGGVKIIRALLIYKQSKREMAYLLHPNAVIPIKFNKITLSDALLESMWGFISVYIALFLFLLVLFIAFDNDMVTAFSAIIAALANAGAGLGEVSTTFATLNIPSKWVLIFAMLAGRLEIFSLLILFNRNFWQK